jgi:hypothetical protein
MATGLFGLTIFFPLASAMKFSYGIEFVCMMTFGLVGIVMAPWDAHRNDLAASQVSGTKPKSFAELLMSPAAPPRAESHQTRSKPTPPVDGS